MPKTIAIRLAITSAPKYK